MSEALATYLHDHLAGSTFGIDLIKSLRDQYSGEPLGNFAEDLLAEIEEDREILKSIIDEVGKGSLDLKEAAAWMAEKVSRFKLQRDHPGGLGTFEALETLGLGILGKLSLWRALRVIGEIDPRVQGHDFEQLAARAQAQHARVEEFRLQVARTAFEGGSK